MAVPEATLDAKDSVGVTSAPVFSGRGDSRPTIWLPGPVSFDSSSFLNIVPAIGKSRRSEVQQFSFRRFSSVVSGIGPL